MKILSALFGGFIFAIFAAFAIEYATNARLSFLTAFVVSYLAGSAVFVTAASTRHAWIRATLCSGAIAFVAACAVIARPWLYGDGIRGPFFGMGTLEIFMIPTLVIPAAILVAIALALRSRRTSTSTVRPSVDVRAT